jgi:ABC-type transport system involved in multi-copper enzyme maturation permease subunit
MSDQPLDPTVVPSPAPAGETVRAPQQAPPFLSAAARVFDLSLGQMLWSRRTIFLGLLVGSPIALGVLFRVLAALGAGGHVEFGGTTATNGATVFGGMIWILYLRFMVPVLGIFYGTALIADEVDDKTLTYLFVRPISRSAVLAGKYLAYLVTTVFVVLPSVVILYLLVVPLGSGSLAGSFIALVKDLMLLAIGLAAYGSLFALIGAFFKHPLVTGLVFAFGWEQIALVLPGYLRRFTIAYYLQALVPHSMPQDGLGGVLQSLFRSVPDPWVSVTCLAAIAVVALVVAGRVVERREYVLEQ